LLIAQGEQFLEVDPQGMQLIATHPLSPDTPSIWHFVLSNDKTKTYTVIYFSGEMSNDFLVINTTTFQMEKLLNLAGGSFEFRPFELPDGSKLYALGGLPNGPVVIHVISSDDFTIQKTITFDQPDRLGISAGPYYPYAYDPVSRTLFVGATHVVLAIDTSTDVIKNVIYLGDVATAIDLQPSQLTYINAVGLVYNPTENYLYIAHLDRSFVSIYDLTNGRFLPKIISLKGYFPNFLFTNDAYDRIYSLNIRSDNVSVIDVPTKTVEKVIDLHDYLHELYLPIILRSTP
jgi:YVTN family beta-propeller protein